MAVKLSEPATKEFAKQVLAALKSMGEPMSSRDLATLLTETQFCKNRKTKSFENDLCTVLTQMTAVGVVSRKSGCVKNAVGREIRVYVYQYVRDFDGNTQAELPINSAQKNDVTAETAKTPEKKMDPVLVINGEVYVTEAYHRAELEAAEANMRAELDAATPPAPIGYHVKVRRVITTDTTNGTFVTLDIDGFEHDIKPGQNIVIGRA